MEIRQIGPGMIQQSHTTCKKCRGAGKICDFVKENKVISLDIEKGMRHETVIKFPEMGDENINRIPADVLFVISTHRKLSKFVKSEIMNFDDFSEESNQNVSCFRNGEWPAKRWRKLKMTR